MSSPKTAVIGLSRDLKIRARRFDRRNGWDKIVKLPRGADLLLVRGLVVGASDP